MRYTHVPIPKYADCNYGLQIFSVKVNQLLLNEEEEEEEGLHWPLHVYGLVATRDSLDPRRNLLFNRTRITAKSSPNRYTTHQFTSSGDTWTFSNAF